MANVLFNINPAEIASANRSGRLTVTLTGRGASGGAGAVNSGSALAQKLPVTGQPTIFNDVIRFSRDQGVLEPMNPSPVASELRAAGSSAARYEASTSAIKTGRLAAAARRAMGARAFTLDGSILTNGGSSPSQDAAIYANEKVHTL